MDLQTTSLQVPMIRASCKLLSILLSSVSASRFSLAKWRNRSNHGKIS